MSYCTTNKIVNTIMINMEYQLLYRYMLILIFIILVVNVNVTQETPSFQSDVNLFADHLKRYAKHSLGVEYLQDHFDEITSPSAVVTDGSKRINDIVRTLDGKTSIAETVLKKLRQDIENEYKTNRNGENRKLKDCCGYNTNLNWNNLLQSKVNLNDFCEIFPKIGHSSCPSQTQNPATNNRLILESYTLAKLKDAYQGSKHLASVIYFARNDGYYVQYPAQNNHKEGTPFCECAKYDARFSPGYVTTSTPQDPQDIIIAVDFSTNMQDKTLFQIMLKSVGMMLDLLDAKDRVLVALFRDGRRYGPLSCLLSLSDVTPALIKSLKDFLAKEEVSGSLKYVDIFKETMRKFNGLDNRRKKIYIVSSGRNEEKRSTVIDEMKRQVAGHNCSISVDILLLTTGSLTAAQRADHTAFQQEICGCGWCTDSNKAANKMIELDTDYVSTDDDIRSTIGALYGTSHGNQQSNVRFTLPHITFNNDGTYLAACVQCMDAQTGEKKQMIGVACISFLSSELFGLGVEQSDEMYVFLIDNTGKVFVHPKYSEPILNEDKPITLDIRNYETANEFESIYNSMISGGSGEKSFLVNTSINTGTGQAIFSEKNYTYFWRKVSSSPFSVAAVISMTSKSIAFDITSTGQKETYHRIDIYNSSDNTCLIKDTIARAAESDIKLPSDVFVRPQTYYKEETKKTIEQITDYLEMKTNALPELFVNSDKAHSVRTSAVATSTITKDVWVKDTSIDRIYTIWRYVGTEDGVFRSFPAHRMHPYFDPRVRPWYIQARANSGTLILTTPYKDAGTGTTLITLAKTLHKKHKSGNITAGVMGIDFNVPYLQSLLYKYVTECETKKYGFKCLIMDESGYLIFHPDFLNVNAATKTHIIDKEPELAKQLIDSDSMKKDYCIGYFKETNETDEVAAAHIRWFYGVKHVSATKEFKDFCLEYILTPVVGTNMVFVKLKNQCTATTPSVCSCPKDTKKTCTRSNMQNMKSCECPCNDYKVCHQDLPPLSSSLICTAPDQRTKIEVVYTKSWLLPDVKRTLQPCIAPMCSRSTTSLECNRLGCEWCYKNANGKVMDHKDKYCGETSTCPKLVTTTTTTQHPPGGIKTPSDETGLSTGELIAVIVVPIVVVVILLIIVFLLWKRKNNQAPEKRPAPPEFELNERPPAAPPRAERPPAAPPREPSVDLVIGNPNREMHESEVSDKQPREQLRDSHIPKVIKEEWI